MSLNWGALKSLKGQPGKGTIPGSFYCPEGPFYFEKEKCRSTTFPSVELHSLATSDQTNKGPNRSKQAPILVVTQLRVASPFPSKTIS